MAFHFGLFQALLPLLGALLGGALLVYVEGLDHWIALGLLTILGGRMIWAGLHGDQDGAAAVDLTRGWSLMGLSIAVSIDALAVGITLPAAGAPIGLAVTLFGLVAGLATLVAMRLAGPIARRIGHRVEGPASAHPPARFNSSSIATWSIPTCPGSSSRVTPSADGPPPRSGWVTRP